MYKISKWKLALIIVVFIISGLYLLPTVPGVYGRLYGYFGIWMQNKISPPDVQSVGVGDYIRFAIPEDRPKGVSIQEASKSIQDIVQRRLNNLKVKNGDFAFDDVSTTHLYVKFSQIKTRAELESIIGELQLGDVLLNSAPVLQENDPLGNIKVSITKNNIPEGQSVNEAIIDVRGKLSEQLIAQGMGDTDFAFSSSAESELHVKFDPQKSSGELDKIIDDMHLYGGLPLTLRPLFPDNPLKQGLDLKGGLHIVLELDVEKAMDIYLSDQAKDAVLGSLKNEKVFCKSVEKKLDKVGDNVVIVRPYVPEGAASDEVQYMTSIRKKLTDMGFREGDIEITSKEVPELTAKMNTEIGIGDLVDNLLDGKNPLIITVTVPQRLQANDRQDYIKTAEETLSKLDLFDNPKRMKSRDQNTVIFAVQLSEDSAKRLAEDNIDTVMETLENRINKFGVAESSIRRVSGRPRILIEIPEEQNPAKTLAAIKSEGILEFKLVVANSATGSPWSGGPDDSEPSLDELPAGTEVRQFIDGGWYVLNSEAFLRGSDLKGNSATVRRDEFGSPEVIMFLTSEGQSKFSDFTGQHVNEFTSIALDDVIQSVPRITEKISSRSARISGSFTQEEADYLAKILRAGAFPAPMKSAEERIVGPTLGREAINRGKLAFTIGISLVIVFMLIYYKGSGAIAIVALLFNFQIILGVLAGFGATLTLPGMAGLILTIGMSVDANVLIFERIREEMRSGKTVRSSIDSGYQKAFWTILDANVTTFLTALVLYEFGTGPIKGFAVTLSIGIMASMFTALVVTREIYRWVYRKRTIAKLSI